MTIVTNLIGAAWSYSMEKEATTAERGIELGLKVESIIPQSEIFLRVQQASRLDCLIRCMESEKSELIERSIESHHPIALLGYDALCILSDMWVTTVYEIIRTLCQRIREEDLNTSTNIKKTPHPELIELLKNLELIRIPLHKHELRRDDNLKKKKIRLHFKPINSDNDPKKYTYDPTDSKRGHITPNSTSSRGSKMWLVIDANEQSTNEFWLERLTLSDQFYAVLEHSLTEITP